MSTRQSFFACAPPCAFGPADARAMPRKPSLRGRKPADAFGVCRYSAADGGSA
jgi:hypothetical protein